MPYVKVPVLSKTIVSIFDKSSNEYANSSLKEKYLKNLTDFQEEKHLETQGYAHVNLPADYFLDQTLEDFIKYANQMHSIILPEEKPLVPKRVILP